MRLVDGRQRRPSTKRFVSPSGGAFVAQSDDERLTRRRTLDPTKNARSDNVGGSGGALPPPNPGKADLVGQDKIEWNIVKILDLVGIF